ncbi:sensor histidine kinase [Paenibacillus assamensis]|uniref:sensor histidine kinase n=1 Tax=Paenibacillus assamensis TaxID=311244 RepID=UPI00048E04C5|nr:HAMP domain-containing sensor histidine kinase [Paenibacillus assamensis]
MRNRIDLKIGISIMSVFLLLFLPTALLMDRLVVSHTYQQKHKEMNELALHFVSMISNDTSLKMDALETMADFTRVTLFVLDSQGKVTARSKHHHEIDPVFLTDEYIRTLQAGNQLEKNITIDKTSYTITGVPMITNGSLQGSIVILNSLTDTEEMLQSHRQILYLAVIAIMSAAAGIIYWLSRRISRPMRQMADATRAIAEGQLETRVEVLSDDEVGSLAHAINHMAEELKRYRDSRNEFIANISHELKTPVTYLEGYAQVIQQEWYETEEEKQQYIGIIADEAKRLNRIIQDLFDLTKMEEGQFSLLPEQVDMNTICQSSLLKVQHMAEQKGLQLQMFAAEPHPYIWGDPVRLEQIMLNLLDNAIRYTKAGDVSIRVITGTEQIRITIIDTGQGIPPDELSYVFERFYRVEKSRSRQYGGSGLGLAIVAKLVDMHQATIDVQSHESIGTTFTITFPRLLS